MRVGVGEGCVFLLVMSVFCSWQMFLIEYIL